MGATSVHECLCAKSFYGSPTDEIGCLPCTEGMVCSKVGTTVDSIITAVGFWRADENSVDVIKCPYGEDSCPNSTVAGCNDGHEGFLCATCSTGFYRDSGNPKTPCSACVTTIFRYIEVGLTMLVMLVVARYVVHKSLKQSKVLKQLIASTGLVGDNKKIQHGVVQRLALSHLQVISLVGKFNLQWPAGVSKGFETASSVSTLSPFGAQFGGGMDCTFRSDGMMYPLFGIVSSIASLVLSVLIVVVYWLFIHPVFAKCCKKAEMGVESTTAESTTAESSRSVKMLISLISLWYMMYSSCASAAFSMLSCEHYPGEDGRLRNALDLKCWSSEHTFLVTTIVVPFVVFVVIGFPLLAMGILYKNRHLLNSEVIVERYGFLFKGYRNEYWFWEGIILLKKLSLAGKLSASITALFVCMNSALARLVCFHTNLGYWDCYLYFCL